MNNNSPMHIFLDTHIWNYMVENKVYSEDELGRARTNLIDGVRQGDWEIVCSLTVLQEIVSTYRNQPQKYDLVKDLIFEAIQHRWLLALNNRYVEELHDGGKLSSTARYLGRKDRKLIQQLAKDKKDIVAVGELAYEKALAFKAGREDAKKQVFTELGPGDGTPPRKIAAAYEKWFSDDRNLEGWVLEILKGGVSRKLYPNSILNGFQPSYDNCPSVWQYVDFSQAKVLLELGYQQKIQPSDGVDADIYGCSPYYDILVTDDGRFRRVIELVVDGRFEVYSFQQLLEMLGLN